MTPHRVTATNEASVTQYGRENRVMPILGSDTRVESEEEAKKLMQRSKLVKFWKFNKMADIKVKKRQIHYEVDMSSVLAAIKNLLAGDYYVCPDIIAFKWVPLSSAFDRDKAITRVTLLDTRYKPGFPQRHRRKWEFSTNSTHTGISGMDYFVHYADAKCIQLQVESTGVPLSHNTHYANMEICVKLAGTTHPSQNGNVYADLRIHIPVPIDMANMDYGTASKNLVMSDDERQRHILELSQMTRMH